MSRFVRDPRDLVVSGYFYHRRGAEAWCRIVDPHTSEWEAEGVYGEVPDGLRQGETYAAYLQRVPREEGLIAEIQFRRRQFEEMRDWPLDDPRILTIRYEDVMGNEAEVFRSIIDFYDRPRWEREMAGVLASRYSAGRRQGVTRHIRNPSSGQWREHFTPGALEYFDSRYGDIVQL